MYAALSMRSGVFERSKVLESELDVGMIHQRRLCIGLELEEDALVDGKLAVLATLVHMCLHTLMCVLEVLPQHGEEVLRSAASSARDAGRSSTIIDIVA